MNNHDKQPEQVPPSTEPLQTGSVQAEPTLRQQAEETLREKAALLPEEQRTLSAEENRQYLHELQVYQRELEMQNEELRRTQVELDVSRTRYFDLSDLAPVGYVTLSEKGLLLESNLTAASFLGMTRGALVMQPISRFIVTEDINIYYAHRKQLVETGASQVCELRMMKEEGTVFWAQLNFTVAHHRDGTPVHRVVLSDITERKQVDEALRESEQNFRTLADSGQALIWTADTDKQCTYFNRVWLEFTGRTLAQERGEGWVEGVHPDDRQRCVDIYVRAFDRREKFSMEYRLRRYDGEYRWLLDDGCPRFDSHGQFIGYIGHCLDISGRKQVEEELSQEQLLMKTLLDSLPGIYFLYSYPELRLVRWNKNHETLLGFGPDEISNRSITDWHPPEAQQAIAEAVAIVMEKGQNRVESPLLTKDGRSIPFILTGVKVEIADQAYLLGVGIEITDRKRAEEEIQRNESRLRRLVNILQCPAETIRDFLDYALDQAIHLTCSKIGYIYHYDEDRQEFVLNAWSKDVLAACAVVNPQTCYHLEKTGIWGEAVRERRPVIVNNFQADHPLKKGYPEGHVPLVKFVTIPIFQGERIISVVGLANKETDYDQTDILQVSLLMEAVWKVTENMRAREENTKLEAQLHQAQKMESVGQLAGGVAHDFNNMLGVILGHAEMAMDQIGPHSPLFEDLQKIQRAAEHSADITRQLLTFARKQNVVPKVIDLNETVEGMLKMLRRLLGEDINLVWIPRTGLWPVKADPSQINQILVNLCVNARDAIAGNGKIIVETENSTVDTGYCAAHPGFYAGEYVRIALSDNGCGMDKATQAHIFEPFFTTKGVGVGTGLGLATVYGAVKQNNGFIAVYSEPGQGTTFTIYLPRYRGKAEEGKGGDAVKPAARGDEIILVVEDEPAILEMTKTMLQRLGYTVLAASTPEVAIRLAGEFVGQIQLLTTDVIMPEMNGHALAKRLQADQPGMKCLFMSGYTADIIANQGVLEEGVSFIQKPFSLKELAAKVRKALEAS